MVKEAEEKPRRRASKELRRRQLILATIKSIAKYGLSGTKLSHVSKAAGLSQGIINFHFKSKEDLLIETLKYIRDDYVETWLKALAACPDEPAAILAVLACVDFDASAFDRNKLAVWFAFWGEASARPIYRRICKERDEGYSQMIIDLMARLAEEGSYEAVNPVAVSTGFQALTEGLWLAIHLSPKSVGREDAKLIALEYLALYFPQHAHNFKE